MPVNLSKLCFSTSSSSKSFVIGKKPVTANIKIQNRIMVSKPLFSLFNNMVLTGGGGCGSCGRK